MFEDGIDAFAYMRADLSTLEEKKEGETII